MNFCLTSQLEFLPVKRDGQILGYAHRTDHHLIFFGTRHANIEVLSEIYPSLKWFRMQQEHGRRLVRMPTVTEELPQADAIWSTERSAGVIVSTADCVPILVVCDEWVSAIHAGWRGVLNEITSQSLRSVYDQCGGRNVRAFIGPHIQQDHFDFDRSGAGPFFDLASALQLEPSTAIREGAPGAAKVKISLKSFVQAQLRASGVISASNISEFLVDTYGQTDFHSYRRERIAGRNLSFIVRL